MFLRNYDNFIAAAHSLSELDSSWAFTGSGSIGDGSLNQIKPNGSVDTNIQFAAYQSYFKAPLSLSCKGICLGNGNSPVTYEDYKLSGDVVENKLVRVSRGRSFNAETGKHTITLVATYSNTSDTDITISEWGLWRWNSSSLPGSEKFSHSSSYTILVFREVLDEPIVIEAGTTATLTFSIEIPMPNHP